MTEKHPIICDEIASNIVTQYIIDIILSMKRVLSVVYLFLLLSCLCQKEKIEISVGNEGGLFNTEKEDKKV